MRLGPVVRRWFFGRVYHVRSIGECGRTVPETESRVTGPGCRCVDPFVWLTSHRLAGEAEFSTGCGGRNCARCARLLSCAAQPSSAPPFSRHSFLLAFDCWFFRASDVALAESRRTSPHEEYSAGHLERFPACLRVCVRVDAGHRSDFVDGACTPPCDLPLHP